MTPHSGGPGEPAVRRAAPDDADRLIDIWRAANTARGVASPLEHEEIVRGQLTRSSTTALVCTGPDDLLGFATAEARVVAGSAVPGATQVLSLFVDPSAQGRGVGRRLLDAVLADAQRRGRPELHLWVRSANDGARRLYERFGFRPVTEQTMAGDVQITAYVRDGTDSDSDSDSA